MLFFKKEGENMDISTMGTVLAIVVITYLIGLAVKQTTLVKDS